MRTIVKNLLQICSSQRKTCGAAALAMALLSLSTRPARGALRDIFPDTWAATDDLGRQLPLFPEAPAPRPDRTVGIFYFLWHGAHIQGGPYDVTKILTADPHAMEKPESPLWGPLHAPHHWGESIFGYYLTRDDSVLRKHAQMLADAGVDMVIFDVTNQVTYRDDYLELLRVWAQARSLGNRTPQVAFLTPFWAPAKVIHELWKDLYAPGLFSDLWFQWEGKPLILADPDLLFTREENAAQNLPAELAAGRSLGQAFSADQSFRAVGARCPTWKSASSAVTLSLWASTEKSGAPLAQKRFTQVKDNDWLMLRAPQALPPGRYYLEASDAAGPIGWWSHRDDVWPKGEAFSDGAPSGGDRTLRIEIEDPETTRIKEFFTFRKPQPDYFQGPTKPNMWSWLEDYPQHLFTNSAGENEQMSVGVAQNAVHGRLGSMSEPEAQGRSFHQGATDVSSQAVRQGWNVAEQWTRALSQDPKFIFVTGWNEWIAGRFAEFNGVKRPVMFVDQFDEEHSRDIEPMKGGHGDDYYWQLVSWIRRYKGARPVPPVLRRPIQIDGQFEDWRAAAPEFMDTAGDPVHRNYRGWDPRITYQNDTGRNDFITARVSWADDWAFFYVKTREPISSPAGTNWMNLLIDLDANARTGWLGYDFVVNRAKAGALERHQGPGYAWEAVGEARWAARGNEMEIAIRWKDLGLSSAPAQFDFKWADNCHQTGTWSDFTLNGDAAPNDRFNYRARLK